MAEKDSAWVSPEEVQKQRELLEARSKIEAPPANPVADLFSGVGLLNNPALLGLPGPSKADKEAMADENKRLRLLMDEAVGRKRATQGRLKKVAQDLKESNEVDWTPVAMFADMMNRARGQKSTLAANYAASGARPMTEAQRVKAIVSAEKEISDAEQDTLKSEIDYSRNMLSGLKNQSQYAQVRQLMLGHQARKDDLKITEQFRKQINTSISNDARIDKSFKGDMEKLAKLESFLSPQADTGMPDFQKVNVVLSAFMRTLGEEKGALSDRDVARAQPASGIKTITGLMAYIKETPSGKLPKDFTKKMLEMVVTSRKNALRERSKNLDKVQEVYGISPNYEKIMEVYGNPRLDIERKFLSSFDKNYMYKDPWEPGYDPEKDTPPPPEPEQAAAGAPPAGVAGATGTTAPTGPPPAGGGMLSPEEWLKQGGK